jgi:hypothetical protein
VVVKILVSVYCQLYKTIEIADTIWKRANESDSTVEEMNALSDAISNALPSFQEG